MSFDRLGDPRAAELRPVGETYLDFGPPLPERYGRDVVRLLARDPECLFAAWEGWGTLRVIDLTVGRDRFFTGPNPGALYVPAEPEHEYEAEIGTGGGATFRASARSNRVRTPRRLPAGAVDEAWPLTAAQEEQFRRLTGLAAARMERGSFGSGTV